jgi:hypothetical protein
MAMGGMVTFQIIGLPALAGLLVLIVFGFCGSAAIGAWIGSKVEAAAFSVPPVVEQAAWTRFTPSTPPPAATEDRIKQPDEPGPDPTEPTQ